MSETTNPENFTTRIADMLALADGCGDAARRPDVSPFFSFRSHRKTRS
jgi:hypothetical protein